MIRAAFEAQHVSDTAREDQKTKLESEIAAANNVMVSGTVTATLFGILLAFSITRAIVNPIKTVVVKTAHAIAEGDFSQEIAIYQNDEIGVLAEAFRNMKDKIRRVLFETDRLIQAVHHRRLDIRGNITGFQGSWRELVIGINNVVDAFKLQEQLILSEKLASVGLLAAGVAHEINNPLEIIYNYLRYIKHKFPDKELHKAINNIYEEISAIAGIVSNLHAFSDNKKRIDEEIALNELIRNMLTLIKHSAKHKQITIHFEPFDDEISIYANKNEIKQVILNLLKNSFEAMPAGGEISIKTTQIHKNGANFVQVTFTDTGPGIQLANPGDIFLPFYSTKKGQEDHLGLGLSVSYGIVTKYKGTISVKNLDSSGCQFIIDIPQSTQNQQ
jgi:signal transduction histidine kinase